jgi:hypothetical protein
MSAANRLTREAAGADFNGGHLCLSACPARSYRILTRSREAKMEILAWRCSRC